MNKTVSCGIVILLLLTNVMILESDFSYNTNAVADEQGQSSSIAPMGPRGPHARIRINSNNEFGTQASAESWPGTGTVGNPYIIQGYTIDAQGNGTCIYIGNTTVYFIIQNCTLTNASGYTLPWGYGAGITITSASYGIIYNNNLTNNKIGICIYGGVNFLTIEKNNCSNNTQFGIYVDSNSDYNSIENNTCMSNGFSGIFITSCRSNLVTNNTCNNNEHNGIEFYVSAINSVINNNICNKNNGSGICLEEYCTNNNIINNICNSNNVSGIGLNSYCTQNLIYNNTCFSNNHSGINVFQSDSNSINTNICFNSSNGSGIIINLCDLCNAINNDCYLNENGIYLLQSDTNSLRLNKCQNNSDGILIETSDNNIINNNSIEFNTWNGIRLIIAAAYNYINFNKISNNGNGINITGIGLSSDLNVISSNIISYNIEHGLFIDNGNNNEFYHNLILFNPYQALDTKSNFWHNNNEGNYWSDYTGVDNGSGGRYAGDGIGDTLIPHPETGYDNYPFTSAWGWLIAPEPELFDPGELNRNGSYTVSWNLTPRAMGYILEEDTEWAFNSPIEVYNGSELFVDLKDRDNATYYYRLKTYISNDESAWSEKVEIIVDWIPSAPTGLNASNPTGDSVTLTWNANPETDIESYKIYNYSMGGGGTEIDTVPGELTEYIITNLMEETKYYFFIVAMDKYSRSQWSNIVNTTTLDVTTPSAPTGLVATAVSDTEISLSWNASTEPDIAGYQIYKNSTSGPSGVFKLNQTVASNVHEYLITGLIEQVTYYFKIVAFDEVPNNSLFSDVASATTPDLTPPHKPTGLNVSDPTESSLSLTWDANIDHDVMGYFIYRNESISGNFENLTSVPVTATQFVDLGLEENTTYYYKIKAIDDAGLVSEFSDIVSGRTKIKTPEPEIKDPIEEIEIYEDTIDTSLHLTDLFPFIDFDPEYIEYLEYLVQDKNFNVTILPNGTIQLTPPRDWSGVLDILFKVEHLNLPFDIQQDLTVTVLPVNDPPESVQILIPNDGKKIMVGDTIYFEGSCNDPDLDYGDSLTFKWSSSLDGDLGFGENISDVKLSVGEHIITLTVTDNDSESASATINIKVEKESAPKSDSTGISMLLLASLAIIILIIILVVIFIILQRKKKPSEAEASVLGEEEVPIQPQLQPQLQILPGSEAPITTPEQPLYPEQIPSQPTQEIPQQLLAPTQVSVQGQYPPVEPSMAETAAQITTPSVGLPTVESVPQLPPAEQPPQQISQQMPPDQQTTAPALPIPPGQPESIPIAPTGEVIEQELEGPEQMPQLQEPQQLVQGPSQTQPLAQDSPEQPLTDATYTDDISTESAQPQTEPKKADESEEQN